MRIWVYLCGFYKSSICAMLTEALYGKQEYSDLFSPFCSPLPGRMLEIKKKYLVKLFQ